MLRDDQKRTLKRWISRKLFGASKKPGVNLRVNGTQFRLQARRVTFRIIHQKAWIDAEESRQQLTCRMGQMGPGAILDLREIRLAQAAANFVLHRRCEFLLGHRTAHSTEGTFYSAEGAEFVAEFHGRTSYCNLQILYYK